MADDGRTGAWSLGLDMWRAQLRGADALDKRAQVRLRRIVNHARAHSRLLSDLYCGIPRDSWTLTDLPTTTKHELMAHFNDWITDLTLTQERVEHFVADPANVGQPLGPAAFVCTSSGTTGVPGLFVHDSQAADIYWINPLVRGFGFWFGPRTFVRFMQHGGREAQVIGTGAHFGGAAWSVAAQRRSEVTRKAIALFPAQQPVAETVAQMNRFDPAVIAGYSTSIEQLAAEQRAGRLRVQPTLVVTSGEAMGAHAEQYISESFGCMVRQSYAASETLFMAHSCAHGWLHLSNDWYILEPIEADGSPTTLGQQSHSVLVTNLANRLQPIIRYDLGDSVLMRPDPCPCDSPLPAFAVAGRSGGLLTFRDDSGREVTVSPMVLGAALELVPDAVRAQVVQVAHDRVEIRFESAHEEHHLGATVGDSLRLVVTKALAANGLENVAVTLPGTAPIADQASGKFSHVVAMSDDPSKG